MIETTATPINDEFNDLLNAEEAPGAPFFDSVLNYLQSQFDKTVSEVGKKQDRVFKLQEEIAQKIAETETIRTLLIEEFRERKPFNPDTGELIDEPFTEVQP